MSLAEEKRAARKEAFRRRAIAHAENAGAVSQALCDHLAGLEGRIISGYLPIRTEASPLAAMEGLARHNRVAVPVVIRAGAPLVFREWTPGCRLERGVFDVMIPVEGAELHPDLVITPLLAFDRGLHRLGYGGGFYDRTLAKLRAEGHVHALGFAYAAQLVEAVPVEATDQLLDAVLTESGVFPLAP